MEGKEPSFPKHRTPNGVSVAEKNRTQTHSLKGRNFKLLVDPCIVKGAKKLYRFDGCVPGDSSWNVTSTKDPRSSLTRIWSRLEVLDLPVPKFKIDDNYVGDPPGIEVLLTNVNDNIDKQFLRQMVEKFGETEEVVIYYHPITQKHLGVARVVFIDVQAASACVSSLNSRSVMGKQLVVILDPFGKECAKTVESLIAVKKKEVVSPLLLQLQEDDKEEQLLDESPDGQSSSQIIPKSNIFVNEGCHSTTETDVPVSELQTEYSLPFSTSHIVPQPMSMYPPPLAPQIAFPGFMGPPPPMGLRPMWSAPHPAAWEIPVPTSSGPLWQQQCWDNTPQSAPLPPCPAPYEEEVQPPEPALDLDARIELLLQGAGGKSVPAQIEEKKNEDINNCMSPPSTPPLPASLLEHFDADKYAPLSPPPSPFLSDEEYLECLLSWRLKHLLMVRLKEKQKRRLQNPDAGDESEGSSEEDAAEASKNTTDDDKMSLSSLSSNNEKIEVVVPSSPQECFPPESDLSSLQLPYSVPENYHPYLQQPTHPPYGWMDYSLQRYHVPEPMFPIQPPRPYPPPLLHPHEFKHHSRPRLRPHFQNITYRPNRSPAQAKIPEKEKPVKPLDITVDLALDEICKRIQATIEKDVLKRMAEALVFNEIDQWWEKEEKKHKLEFQELEKKDEKDNNRTTTENLLNSIIDSTYDVGYAPTGFSLGFRAALPKMPSFKIKRSPVVPQKKEEKEVKQDNESDQEEMVQVSDSELDQNEAQKVQKASEVKLPSLEVKKEGIRVSDSSSSSSKSSDSGSDSESDSSSSSSSSSSSVSNSSAHSGSSSVSNQSKMMEDSVPLIKPEDPKRIIQGVKKEEAINKIPLDCLSGSDSEDFSKPPKTPDIHLSDAEDLPRTPSPNGRFLPNNAVQALIALGLDEFDLKFEERPQKRHSKVRTPSPTVPFSALTEEKNKVISPIKERAKGVEDTSKRDVKKEKHKDRGKKLKLKGREEKNEVKNKKRNKRVHSDSSSLSEDSFTKIDSYSLLGHNNNYKYSSHGVKYYPARTPQQEGAIGYLFLAEGIDEEDNKYSKMAFERMSADETHSQWMSNTHWVEHCNTDLNGAGCARAKGFYKLDPKTKQKNKHHFNKDKPVAATKSEDVRLPPANSNISREARNQQRRILTALGTISESELLKFNQLKFRKKRVTYGKSEIHDWGLFALEPIAADEMVIEYVGHVVRQSVADVREKSYQRVSIGSSYFFRIDQDTIIDATHSGNLSRLINHSCNPNCYAKIITIEGKKKVVIYSRRDIKMYEELTYDYKFELEEEKIDCLCGEPQCRGSLN